MPPQRACSQAQSIMRREKSNAPGSGLGIAWADRPAICAYFTNSPRTTSAGLTPKRLLTPRCRDARIGRPRKVDDKVIAVEFGDLADKIRAHVKAAANFAARCVFGRGHDHPDGQILISRQGEMSAQKRR